MILTHPPQKRMRPMRERTAYEPLSQQNEGDSVFEDAELLFKQTQRKQKIATCVLVIVTLLLVMSNVGWLWSSWPLPPILRNYSDHRTVLKPLYWSTPFVGSDKAVSNDLWRHLFPASEGLISLPHSWATKQSLPTTVDDQHKPGNGVYFVAAYHQLHCLSVIRAALYHYHEKDAQTVEWMHMMHCVDSLRQAVMCRADDTLLYTNGNGTVGVSQQFGDGQLRSCRDLTVLRLWTEAHGLEG
ncbi:hypothetical protein MMC19_005266 [Ptychographa xylographoides]|nr:hypothetical protein [Ptychographa xylographoides]